MTNLLIRIFIGNQNNLKNSHVRKKFGNLSGFTGILLNAILCFIKIATGVVSGAMSLVADGLNNALNDILNER